MRIDRQVKKFTISSRESVINALQKMSQTGTRMILLTSEAGVLEGVFTDGDLRLWLARQKDADLTKPISEAANKNFISASINETPETIAGLFAETIRFIPLVDARGRLMAMATTEEEYLQIGNFVIDSHAPVFVIAEIGNNHNGSVELAKKLVDAAIQAGADCVKFQTYKASKLASKNSPSYWDLKSEPTTSQHELFSRFDKFGDGEYLALAEYSKTKGVDFASTPFDLEAGHTQAGQIGHQLVR